MPKNLHEMDERELGALLEKLGEIVERLAREKPASDEYNCEVGVLSDVRRLLAAKRKSAPPEQRDISK